MLNIIYFNRVLSFNIVFVYPLFVDTYIQIKLCKLNLLTLNLLVTATMKNAAKCENVL